MIKVNKAMILSGKSGSGESYKLLSTPMNIGHETFVSDTEEGAHHFKECENIVVKNLGKCVVVEANTEEEGLLAITYMNCMANEARRTSKYAGNSEDARTNVIDEAILESSEHDEWDDGWDLPEEYGFDDDIMDILTNANVIPIVSYAEANSRINKDSFVPFTMLNQPMAVSQKQDDDYPYWMTDCINSIIIVKHESYGMAFRFNSNDDGIVDYYNPRTRVYYLVVRDESGSTFDDPYDDCLSFNDETSFGRFLMEHTADRINVTAPKGVREAYNVALFKSWLDKYEMTVDKEEDLDEIVKNVVRFNEDFPGASMEKTLKYIKHLEPDETVISLDNLKHLGLITETKVEDATDTSIDKLVGMDSIKDEVKGIVQYTRYYKDMLKCGNLKGELHNVYMFVGAPGTAKTTVAKELGRLMKEAGILRRDRFISVTGAELKGQFVGWTAPKVARIFEENDIILIDEAYSLTSSTNGQMDIFAQEALAQLAIELEEHTADKVVIFAGYGGNVSDKDNKMEEFLKANPGIKSRINAVLVFESYNGEEMLGIIHSIAKEKGLAMVHTADREIVRYFDERSRCDAFGNGREARNFVDSALRKVALRYDPSKPMTKSCYTITKRDIIETLESLRKEPGRLSRVVKYGF